MMRKLPPIERKIRDYADSIANGPKADRELSDYEAILPGITRAVSSRKNPWVLDVGHGFGFALHDIKKITNARTMGISLSVHRSNNTPGWVSSQSLNEVIKRKKMPKFDVISSVFCFHYVPRLLETIEFLCNNALKPGGEAFLHVGTEDFLTREDVLIPNSNNGISWADEIARMKRNGLQIKLLAGRDPQGGPRPIVIHYKNTGIGKVSFPYKFKDFDIRHGYRMCRQYSLKQPTKRLIKQ